MACTHFFRTLLALSAVVGATSIAACAAPTADDDGESGAAISGSLRTAQSCAIRDRYLSAPLESFEFTTLDQLLSPEKVKELGARDVTVANFGVDGVGLVFVVEEHRIHWNFSKVEDGLPEQTPDAAVLAFYEHRTGKPLVVAVETAVDKLAFYSVTSGATLAPSDADGGGYKVEHGTIVAPLKCPNDPPAGSGPDLGDAGVSAGDGGVSP